MVSHIFVTGCAGFIGFHLSKRLLDEGVHVLGIDNINNYYDMSLKNDRLNILTKYRNFCFIRGSIENLELLESLFDQYDINIVVNLAAQAGVRYSLENPHAYIQSNLVGFANILDCCKKHQIKHLIYASSSSVYGDNKQIPFSVGDRVDHPISLYAATKKANELMAYTYSHLYNLPTTGLRLFTVYGPWGRPDMAAFKFANAILRQQPIEVYNHGNMKRDFTYIDDVIESIFRLIQKDPPTESFAFYKIYNIGNHQPVQLNYFIQVLEEQLGKKAVVKLLPLQPGDVLETYADIEELVNDINFKPKTPIEEGISKFVSWFKQYNKTP
ncbi:NAD-dependent epimerase [Neobacillus massiliamazoniensis]|uniref:NAD-dependent epimerase/dehydratase n=1 Tax=Neobacillus massiliamazoniensis TaxID=1499688 RepID=A0A0U1NTW2_9BACI|nr:NAD-dependent epimerase [Neobacillus massiliamazoniensis]CRK81501.1 NAD-dependent epimerase/dehydratase [Neobacillus massiliamazoniensis]